MDISTVLGFVGAIIVIVFGILTTGKLSTYYDVGSVYITIGGTIASLLLTFPFSTLKNIGKAILKVFFPPKINPQKTIQMMIDIAECARKDGLLALEKKCNDYNDNFIKNGINIVMESNEPDKVRDALETELAFMEDRHSSVIEVFEKGAVYAPAFGMIGTLIGLINMLLNLSEPDSLGPSMSVALITTFYGSIMANMIFLPIAGKLKLRSQEEILDKQIIVEGLIAIQSGDNPRTINDKLQSFLSPKQRVPMGSKETDGKPIRRKDGKVSGKPPVTIK